MPALAYGLLIVFAAIARVHVETAMFGAAAAALMLLFSGIHNAWDTIAYQVFVMRRDEVMKPPADSA